MNCRPANRELPFHHSLPCSAVNVSSVTKGGQEKLIVRQIELVNDPVVSDAKPEFGTALKPHVWKIFKPAAQVANLRFDSASNIGRKAGENGIELVGVNLRRLIHTRSGFSHTHTPLAQVCFAPFNAGDKFRFQFGFVLKVIGEPVLKLKRLFSRQGANFVFECLKVVHIDRVSAMKIPVNEIDSSGGSSHFAERGCVQRTSRSASTGRTAWCCADVLRLVGTTVCVGCGGASLRRCPDFRRRAKRCWRSRGASPEPRRAGSGENKVGGAAAPPYHAKTRMDDTAALLVKMRLLLIRV